MCPTHDDTGNGITGVVRDPHTVTRYALLAHEMPSLLNHLRPMDLSSDGMLKFLTTKRSQLSRRTALAAAAADANG